MTSKSVLDKDVTFVEASNLALAHALETDDRVFLLGEDIADDQGGGVFQVTAGLSAKFGVERVRSTPISEQAIMGAAVGAAIAGLRPVAEIMLMNFMSVAMDQFANHAAKLRYMSGGQTPVPLTVRTATGVGGQFGAQHSDMLEVWLAHLPGCKVVVPSNPADAYGLLLSCIFDDDPCLIVENTLLYFGGVKGSAPEPGSRVPLGVANVVQPGSDLTVIGYGRPFLDSVAVANELAGEGISVELIDLRTVAPYDERCVLDSVAKTKRAVIVHEAVRRHGVGAEIAARINEELFGELEAPVARVGAKFTPVPYASNLETLYYPGSPDVMGAIRKTLG
jgi:acetoin:2,6-dichlorophenolindophenol oxidoreductase subunit beta